MRRRPLWHIPLAALLTTLVVSNSAPGQSSSWFEGFESPEPIWRFAGGNTAARVHLHQRSQAEAHSGSGCERLQISGTGGSEVYFGLDVGRPQVIPELLPTLWIKADRAGIQLLVQVVFPRNPDPRTNRPLALVVPGSSYSTVGRWQQLRIEDIPQAIKRQTWALRSSLAPASIPAARTSSVCC